MPINDTAIKAPQRRTSSSGSKAVATPVISTQTPNERRAQGLMSLGQLAQGVLLMTNQYADAAAIGQHFQPIAIELANIADANEAIAKPIDFLIEIGPYGALVTAVLPLALQLAANHGLLNANAMLGQGVVPPDVLESKMKAQVAQMQAIAMREQQEAMRQAREAQKEYEQILKEYESVATEA